MSEKRIWEKIIEGLDGAQQAILQRFVFNAITRVPVTLWLFGPAASGRSALVRSVSAAVGTVVVISGYDLDRGGRALEPLYEVATNKAIASLLIVKIGRLSQRSFDVLPMLGSLVTGDPVVVFAKRRPSVQWVCDIPILFVADDPPPVDSGLDRRVDVLELTPVSKKRKPITEFTAAFGRTVRRWALSRV